jgi:hypothetical protein
MTTKTVYRYENAKGEGPYQNPWNPDLKQMRRDHTGNPSTPGWSQEGWGTIPEEWRGGCATLEQLLEWFAGWENVLERNGYFVVTYEVPEEDYIWCNSGKQIIFVKRRNLSPVVPLKDTETNH